MPQRVVDDLELIQIDEADHIARPRALYLTGCLLHPPLELLAVQQAGQRIVRSAIVEFVGQQGLIGQVGNRTHRAFDPVIAEHAGDRQPCDQFPAVAGQDDAIFGDVPCRALAQGPQNRTFQRLSVRRHQRQDLIVRTPQRLLSRPADQSLGRRHQLHDMRLGVDHQQAVADGAHGRRQLPAGSGLEMRLANFDDGFAIADARQTKPHRLFGLATHQRKIALDRFAVIQCIPDLCEMLEPGRRHHIGKTAVHQAAGWQLQQIADGCAGLQHGRVVGKQHHCRIGQPHPFAHRRCRTIVQKNAHHRSLTKRRLQMKSPNPTMHRMFPAFSAPTNVTHCRLQTDRTTLLSTRIRVRSAIDKLPGCPYGASADRTGSAKARI